MDAAVARAINYRTLWTLRMCLGRQGVTVVVVTLFKLVNLTIVPSCRVLCLSLVQCTKVYLCRGTHISVVYAPKPPQPSYGHL